VKKKGEGNHFIEESIEHSSIPYRALSPVIVDFNIKLQPVLKPTWDHNTNGSNRKQSRYINKGKSIFTLFATGFFYSSSTTLLSSDILHREEAEQRSAHISANKLAANLC
jgi:hypothetical protein